MKLRAGTRGSALALQQAGYVASLIESEHPSIRVELVIIKTTGDKLLDAPLATIGGKGLFTKEIEEALLDKRVDIAVHSMKDLPTELPTGLTVGAILQREDPRDVFVSGDDRRLEDLASGEKVGTSSLRRKAFLLNRFQHLAIVSIRGNLDTRLRKIQSEGLAGIMIASAGMKRLGFEGRITTHMEPEFMIPAIGQGALGVEIRENDSDVQSIVSRMNHEETALCVRIERAFLRRMGGGCQVPLAAFARTDGDAMTVYAAVVHPDGTPMLRETYAGPKGTPTIGAQIADILISRGADAIMRSVTGNDWLQGPTAEE